MADKTVKLSSGLNYNVERSKDAITECSEDFPQELEHIPSHPSFVQPLLEQGELSEDSRKLLRKIKQDPEWKKRVEKMLNFEVHTLKGRLSWEQDKLRDQNRWLANLKEEGEKTHSDQLLEINQLKQSLREQLTNRIKLESNLAEEKRVNKKLAEESKKAAKPRPKLTEILNRSNQRDTPIDSSDQQPPSPRSAANLTRSSLSLSASRQSVQTEEGHPGETAEASRTASPSPSRPSSSKRGRKQKEESPVKSTGVLDRSSGSKISLSEGRQATPVTQSLESIKLPKIVNSPLISAPDQEVKPISVPLDPSIHSFIAPEDSAVSIKSKCSRCGSKKPRLDKSPRNSSSSSSTGSRRQEFPYAYPSLPSHNLHLSSPPVIIQQAPMPMPYPYTCHECDPHAHHHPHPQHTCHQQHHTCSPCCTPKEDNFSQEFECLKDFIREEIRSGWSRSPKSRRPKSYSSRHEYAPSSGTTTTSETEDPYHLSELSSSSSKGSRGSKSYKVWKPHSGHSLAATHSLATNRSDTSSVLEDELFLKLVSNPAKYSYELQEIAKLLTSPPASRVSSTTSRQKLRTIKHLVREAITSYSTSDLESSDTQDEGLPPRPPDEPTSSEESDMNPSRLDHVSSRALHKARRAKEMRVEESYISPMASILKTASRPSESGVDPSASQAGIKRVNFSAETINIDNGQSVQMGGDIPDIPDDFVVVEEDEISLATQEMQENINAYEQTHAPPTKLVAYPYDLYMAGERTEACTIVQNESEDGEGARAQAAERIVSELGIESEVGSLISVSHSLELKASLPSIPSFVSEATSRNSLSQRPNRPGLESGASRNRMNAGLGAGSSQASLLSHSSASLNQIIPREPSDDELEEEKRRTRSQQNIEQSSEPGNNEDTHPAEIQPHERRRKSLTLREHESRRLSITQMSRISLVSRPSAQINPQPPALEEEAPTTQPSIEKQTSRSSLVEKASKILSSFTSLVSHKSNNFGARSAPHEVGRVPELRSNPSLRSSSNPSLRSSSNRTVNIQEMAGGRSSASRSESRQLEVASRSQSRQDDIPSRNQSRQEDIEKVKSSLGCRSQSRQDDAPSRSQSRQDDIEKVKSSLSISQSRQDVPSRSQSRQDDIEKVKSSLSISQSRQDVPSRSQSRQEDVPSRSQSRQEDVPSRSQSRQEDIEKVKSSLSISQSRQDVPSRSQSRQEDIETANEDKTESGQDKVDPPIESRDVSNINIERVQSSINSPPDQEQGRDSNIPEDSSNGCECTDCPDPTQCAEDCSPADMNQNDEPDLPLSRQESQMEVTLSKTSLKSLSNSQSQVKLSASVEKSDNLSPNSSEEAPVKILLSSQVVESEGADEGEREMGVKMTFSKEWKIICTKDCPEGVEETTITDWRDPNWEESEFYSRDLALTSDSEKVPIPEGERLASTSRSLSSLPDSREQSESAVVEINPAVSNTSVRSSSQNDTLKQEEVINDNPGDGCECTDCPDPTQCAEDCTPADVNPSNEPDLPLSRQESQMEVTLSKSSLKSLSNSQSQVNDGPAARDAPNTETEEIPAPESSGSDIIAEVQSAVQSEVSNSNSQVREIPTEVHPADPGDTKPEPVDDMTTTPNGEGGNAVGEAAIESETGLQEEKESNVGENAGESTAENAASEEITVNTDNVTEGNTNKVEESTNSGNNGESTEVLSATEQDETEPEVKQTQSVATNNETENSDQVEEREEQDEMTDAKIQNNYNSAGPIQEVKPTQTELGITEIETDTENPDRVAENETNVDSPNKAVESSPTQTAPLEGTEQVSQQENTVANTDAASPSTPNDSNQA